jgi:hypothetical protein
MTGLRERIRQAIEGPVGESQKVLGELKAASTETRLSILISGWGRGLAAGLEELAIAVDELLETELRTRRGPTTSTAADERPSEPVPEEEQTEDSAPTSSAGDGEKQLRERAKESREQTAKLREESEQLRNDLAP